MWLFNCQKMLDFLSKYHPCFYSKSGKPEIWKYPLLCGECINFIRYKKWKELNDNRLNKIERKIDKSFSRLKLFIYIALPLAILLTVTDYYYSVSN